MFLLVAPYGIALPGDDGPGDELVPDIGVPQQDLVTRDYIVGFYETIPRDAQPGDTFHGGKVISTNVPLAFAVVRTNNPVLFEGTVKADDRVKYIEWDDPAYAVVNLVPNDSLYGDAGHYGSKIIGGEAAWDRTTGSTAVIVGVIDSGLRKTHQEFSGSGRVLQGYDFANSDTDPNDDCGHGTHVSGTIAATINNGVGIAGMAQATILPIKALASSWLGCTGSTSALANALQYAADEGAHISSNSWGGGASTSITNAINYAYNAGVTQIAAAGNDGPCTNCVGEPWKGNAAKVIIVASTTSTDTQSSFSSEGPEIDVAAPGSDILSSWHTSNTAYAYSSGTSMATPHVSGVAALMLTLDGTLTFSDIDSTLKSTAVDLGPAGKDDDFGDGRIDADAATAAVSGGGGGPTPQCSDGLDNDGDGLTDYPADPGCTDANDDDEYNAPPPGTVFSEGFESGGAGWTVNGGGTLWHINSGCGTAHGGSNKLVWADSTSCTYDVGDTGLDWAKSPVIDLSGYTTATASFWHWFETENYSGGAYDVLTVQRSCNDTSWTTMEQWDSTDPNVSSWTQESYDVSACAGGNLWLRWTGDSIDGSFNNYDGWRVDDVEVTAS